MPRFKRKRSARPTRRTKARGNTSLRRRKAKKMGRKFKSAGIPRTIVSADFQRRTQAVNFEYTQQWVVTPGLLPVANSLQILTFVMNDPTNLFGANLPFGANLSNVVGSIPNYAAAQTPYTETNGIVDNAQVGSFANWSKRYEKACVIGSKVTCVLRPKMVIREDQRAEFRAEPQGAVGSAPSLPYDYPAVSSYELPLDASRIVTILTDAKPFDTDPESINTTSKIPGIIKRAGVQQKRMSYTPAGKDGAFATVSYSPKKFHNLKDLKDNSRMWSDINQATGNLTMTSRGQTMDKVYGMIAIQKEELNSPASATALSAKKQHDYYIECKYSCTVLFKDPFEITGTNVPTATARAPGDVHMGDL